LGKYAMEKTERVLKVRQRELEAVKQLGLETEYC
jgi:hypothetical protein